MEQVFYIDLKNVTTKEALQDVLVKELPLPDYYGRNLDALYDVLTEFGRGWNIIIYNTENASRGKEPSQEPSSSEFAGYLEMLKRMCARATAECDNLQIRFYP